MEEISNSPIEEPSCSYCFEQKDLLNVSKDLLNCEGEDDCKEKICKECAEKFVELEYWFEVNPRCCFFVDGKKCNRLLCRECICICHECANWDVVDTFCSRHAPEYRLIECSDCQAGWYICPKHPPKEDECGRGCHRSIPDY